MINIDSQRNKFNIVISDVSRLGNPIGDLLSALSMNGYLYYVILHDKDINNHGELKRPHYHVIIRSLKRDRVKTIIKWFCDLLKTNEENIQVQECQNFVACVQYLIHKNDLDKHQYSCDSIITNDSINLIPYLNEVVVTEYVTTQQLLDYIFVNKMNRKELIVALGIGAYQHYRNTINDLLNARDFENSRQQL